MFYRVFLVFMYLQYFSFHATSLSFLRLFLSFAYCLTVIINSLALNVRFVRMIYYYFIITTSTECAEGLI